jgi:hypothetical protein
LVSKIASMFLLCAKAAARRATLQPKRYLCQGK